MLTAYTKPLLAEYPALEDSPKYQRLVRPPKPQKETNPKAYAKKRKQKESRKRNRK